MMEIFWGRNPGTAAATRFRIAWNSFPVEAGHAGHGQQYARLGVLPLARERLPARQHEMHPRAAHAMDRTDRSSQLAFQRARLVHLLLELVRGEPVASIEYLVADRSARGEAFLGEQHAGARYLVFRHQDLTALRLQAIRDVLSRKLLRHLRRFAQIELTV